MRKPLIWDLVKNSKRFQFLPANQVEHIEINMSVTQQGQDGIWKEKKRIRHSSFNFYLAGLSNIISGERLWRL